MQAITPTTTSQQLLDYPSPLPHTYFLPSSICGTNQTLAINDHSVLSVTRWQAPLKYFI